MEDGRTAFALQVRGEDGWGERIEPRANLFRRVEDARVGRWANSSLLELDSGHTVRISARAEDDGRIEFALQEIIDGQPAERILPRLRKFPANPTVGKWLVSSPIELAAIAAEEPAVEEPPSPYVPVINANGWTGNVQYQSGLDPDGQVWTTIDTRTDDSQMFLRIGCWSTGEHFNVLIDQVPPLDTSHASVHWSVDGGESVVEQWPVHTFEDSHSFVSSASPPGMLETLRGASSFTFWINEPGFRSVTLDLSDTFSTPVQDNIDNCGNYVKGETREIEYDYVPSTGAERLSASLQYRAFVIGDGVNTDISNDVPTQGAVEGRLRFQVACWSAGTSLNMQVLGFPMGEQSPVEVTITFADSSTHVSNWRVDPNGSGVQTALPPSLLARFVESSTVTFTIEGVGYSPMTFDLTGMFETPVQENVVNCGMNKRGESREVDLPESPVVSGRMHSSDGESTIDWSLSPVGGTIASMWIRQMIFGNELEVFFWTACGPNGAIFWMSGTRFGDLSADEVGLVWSVDGGAEQRDTWAVVHENGDWVHPESTSALIAAWRDGSRLELTFDSAPEYTHQVNLTELFGTPIQDALDECLALPQPSLPAPAGAVDGTTVEQLYYVSGKTAGSDVASTSLQLRVASDSAPAWAGYSTRLETHCGIGGFRIAIWGLGLDRPAFIRGYSVDVTWSVDGGPESTSTWEVWPWNNEYYAISPPDDAAFYAAIKDADSLTITVASDPEFVETYDFAGAGFWSTPVQPNLDACVGS